MALAKKAQNFIDARADPIDMDEDEKEMLSEAHCSLLVCSEVTCITRSFAALFMGAVSCPGRSIVWNRPLMTTWE